MALIETLTDDFDDNSINTSLWDLTVGGGGNTTLAETNGRLEIVADNGSEDSAKLVSDLTYDLTGSYAAVEMSSASISGSGELGLSLMESPDLDNYFLVDGLHFHLDFDGGEFLVAFWFEEDITPHLLASDTYSATNHKWIRIREDSGTVYWEVASDAQREANNWQSFASELVSTLVSAGVDITALYAVLGFTTTGGTSSGAAVNFDNFNVPSSIIPQDAGWSFAADNTTLTQLHIIQTQDASFGFTADAGSVAPVLLPADAAWGFTADQATITQNHVFSPADASWAFSVDAGFVGPELEAADASWDFTADETSIVIFRKPPTAYSKPAKPTTGYSRPAKPTTAYV